MKLLQLVNSTILALVVLVCFSFTTSEIKIKKSYSKEMINPIIPDDDREFCVEINYFSPENRIPAINDFLSKYDLKIVKFLYRTNIHTEGLRVKKRPHVVETIKVLDKDHEKPGFDKLIEQSYLFRLIDCSYDGKDNDLGDVFFEF